MATMKDIARLAGVSTSTVSHVINKSRYVSEEISERVNKAAQELNYRHGYLISPVVVKHVEAAVESTLENRTITPNICTWPEAKFSTLNKVSS